MEIRYVKGDATNPIGQGNKVIVHVCNDVGGWGKGFVMAISKRWKQPENSYREWWKSSRNFELGEVQFVQVEPTIWIANLIGQHDIKRGKD
jgi:O-acetyl-ADP-ribose deacetylase (regulator of RNase III)